MWVKLKEIDQDINFLFVVSFLIVIKAVGIESIMSF